MTFLQRTARIFLAACLLLTLPGLAASRTEDSRGLKPITLAIPGESQPVALYGESHALIIGVSDYNNGWPKLPGVKSDVEAVAKALEKQGFSVTKMMNPTGEKLDRAIKHFVSQHGQLKDSRLLIYFAGHGYTLKPDAERQLGYLVPVDAPLSERDPSGFIETALSMETMEGYAKQIRAKHALFVFDACFSGAFFKMRAAPEVIALKTTQPVRQFITSGGADQQVPDISIFRQEFVAALEGAADLNHDGYITGSELGSYLEDKVTNYSHQTQTPQYGKIQDRNLDKGDFVFALANPTGQVKPMVKPMTQGPDSPAAGRAQPRISIQSDTEIEQELWNDIRDSNNSTDFENYLSAYPKGRFVAIALHKLKELSKASQGTSKLENKYVFVRVNGRSVPVSALRVILAEQIAKGQKDDENLRAAIREELIRRELLGMKAAKERLGSLPEPSKAVSDEVLAKPRLQV